MVGMYLLYLRVSGTFHLIVGLLLMFGFNLPEIHHMYFLATSFTDLWRRINIYWKDFVMKLFFYPMHFKLRKMGTLRAMTVATLVTFFATWALHSWQWFWIRGVPLFTWKDFAFWVILALLVLGTALYEATWGRKRTLTPSRVTLRRRLMFGVEAAGVFCLMCILWTLWTCQSWAEFQTLIDAASKPTVRDIAIILAAMGAICVCGMIWGRVSRETSEGRSTQETRKPFSFWPSAGAVSVGALCLLVAPSVATRATPSVRHIVTGLHGNVLNERDVALQRRGTTRSLTSPQWIIGRAPRLRQANRRLGKGLKVFYRQRSDFMLTDINPSVSTFSQAPAWGRNSLGMRDREYDPIKPPNTYRIVLVGFTQARK
jgi:hypothetical protein